MVTAAKFLGGMWEAISMWFRERTVDISVTCVALIIVFIAIIYIHFLAPSSLERLSKVVTIQPGTSFQDISRILEESRVVRDRRSFYLLARLEKAIPRVKAGEYEVNTAMTPDAVLSKLVRGDVIKYPITIPEGYDIDQIAEVLEKAEVCSRKSFLAKAVDSLFIASLGLDLESLEGYLFPDTYNFPKGFGEDQVMHQMVNRFKSVFAPLGKRAEQLGLTPRDVIILASMIEKEAVDDQERRLIAAVFHNRLQRGMALQSDPTAVYGLRSRKSKKERITREDLLRKTPYNTYHLTGLPKGPISNPGLKSIRAVLYPADVNYLYFVSKNDGTLYFSSTLQEHNRAVSKFQKKARKEINPQPASHSIPALPADPAIPKEDA